MDFTNASFNLQIFDYMISQYQGKYSCISVLSALNSVHFKSGEQIFVKNDLIKTEKMRREIIEGQKVYFDKGKCLNDNTEYRTLKSSLEQMSMDLLNQAEKVEPIIDSTDYSSDQEKVNFLVASYARVCYQRYHQFVCNLDSAIKLNLQQDAINLQRMKDAAQNHIAEFDNFVQSTMLSKQLVSKEIYITFWENCVTLGALLRSFCHDIDVFKVLCEKENFEYSDYAYISPNEIPEWKNLNIPAQSIGYWKACDFTPAKASPWINSNITDPFTCLTCIKFKISLDDAMLSLQNQIPLVLTRRWLAQGVSLIDGIEKMKQGEMPTIINENERML